MSVTNAAEMVVEDLVKRHILDEGKRLFYIDTMDQTDELLHENGFFTGFAPGGLIRNERPNSTK